MDISIFGSETPTHPPNMDKNKNKTKSLTDTKASYNGYRRKNGLYAISLTYLLTYSHTPNLQMLSHLKRHVVFWAF